MAISISNKIKLRSDEEIVEEIKSSSLKFFWSYLLAFTIIFSLSFFTFWLMHQGWYGLFVIIACFLAFFALLWSVHRKRSANYWVLTNQRLIDVERSGVFSEHISFVDYNSILSVNIRKKGILPRIFSLGDLLVETENDEYIISLLAVRHPQIVLEWILSLVNLSNQKDDIKNKQSIINTFKKNIATLNKNEAIEIINRLNNRISLINSSDS